ncbi:MAG: pilus assembly protein PilM [Candidatus Eremiobacteraeota bacterium]|nr:pilus assembly protein PilM [Candidatus Eremiobacteraeota bacterium]
MKKRSLPLGIDIGSTRVRVALAQWREDGPYVAGVAVREITDGSASSGGIAEPAYVGALIEEAIQELGTRERRCVCAIGEPDALMRTITLPKMSGSERERAARFEAQRHIDFPIEEATVRLRPVGEDVGTYALGIVRSSVLTSRQQAVKAGRLRAVAIDHDACALARLLPGCDAAIDVGHRRTSVHLYGSVTPRTVQIYCGGADITRSIERELSIDERSAEKRKRILGTAGAGERHRSRLVADIASSIDSAYERRKRPERIALVGNGARLLGLAAEIEAATGAIVDRNPGCAMHGAYPDDVVRASSPDWSLAVGLALWNVAVC